MFNLYGKLLHQQAAHAKPHSTACLEVVTSAGHLMHRSPAVMFHVVYKLVMVSQVISEIQFCLSLIMLYILSHRHSNFL